MTPQSPHPPCPWCGTALYDRMPACPSCGGALEGHNAAPGPASPGHAPHHGYGAPDGYAPPPHGQAPHGYGPGYGAPPHSAGPPQGWPDGWAPPQPGTPWAGQAPPPANPWMAQQGYGHGAMVPYGHHPPAPTNPWPVPKGAVIAIGIFADLLIALVLWLVWKDKHPEAASTLMKTFAVKTAATVGIILSMLLLL